VDPKDTPNLRGAPPLVLAEGRLASCGREDVHGFPPPVGSYIGLVVDRFPIRPDLIFFFLPPTFFFANN